MSATALLSELRRRQIELRADGSELLCSAPAGALTAELREELRLHKRDLLALLASAQALSGHGRAIVPLQPHGRRAPVFGVAGHNGDVFCYRLLARCLGREQPFYGLQPPGLDGEGEPLARVEDLADYFARQMLAFRPEGGWIVAGFCAGGTVAFELARQLAARGRAVRFLALFGSPFPPYFTHRMRIRLGLRRGLMHARALVRRSPPERRRYIAEKLGLQRERREAARAAALDPVLRRRLEVERATLAAVRRYAPRPFDGRIDLFLPGPQWRASGVAAERWGELAAQAHPHYGPEPSDGADMLREAHAPAFAELFRRCCYGRDGGGSKEPD